jgi:hypothetical protein
MGRLHSTHDLLLKVNTSCFGNYTLDLFPYTTEELKMKVTVIMLREHAYHPDDGHEKTRKRHQNVIITIFHMVLQSDVCEKEKQL